MERGHGMAIKMYSTRWCADCWRAKWFLRRNDVVFEEINIDDSEEAAELVMRQNEGKRRVPTFDIDGSYHGNPPLGELARLLGIP